MKIAEVLHSFWVWNRTEHPRTRRSWLELNKAIQEIVSAEQQENFIHMIEDHCYAAEYSGFVAGFKMDTKL